MYIYRSNRTEQLLDALARVAAEPLASPATAECIVVQSRGMSTWISMHLSRLFGVWCNPDFPHPRQLIQRTLHAFFGKDAEHAKAFIRERLVFLLLETVPEGLDQASFAPLKRFLRESAAGENKLLQLAQRLAYLFDQYMIYRPELLLAWENGENPVVLGDDDLWQPVLWRSICERLTPPSPPQLLRNLIEGLAAGDLRAAQESLPQRISLFGIASLPPLYLEVLQAISRHIPVHFFMLAPSEQYWADLRSEKEINTLLRKQEAFARQPAELFLETGHRLLAALGKLGRDFQLLVEELTDYEEPAGELFVEQHPPATLLEALQNDILTLNSGREKSGAPPRLLVDQDRSIAIHAAHGPLREVEILHDQLLLLFNQNDRLKPRDVVVMMPDVNLYAPFIDAVFARDVDAPDFIPYRIADRTLAIDAPLVAAFLQLLTLNRQRLSGPDLLQFLDCEAVRNRFNIVEDDRDSIRRWILETGICWGIDERHRSAHNQPPARQNTWAFGIDRLVLGYAMGGEEQPLFEHVLPYAATGAQDAELLGNFIEFCEAVFSLAAALDQPRTPTDWQLFLGELLQTFFKADRSSDWQLQTIRDAVAETVRDAAAVQFREKLESELIRTLLAERLAGLSSAYGFLEGGITFCALLPMRSIPFKVVCLLGLNDADFPRIQYADGFDLIGRYPKPGDRSKRTDDRYMFLEALLSAREKLYLSYVGMDIKSGMRLPPSAVVDELIDCIAESFTLPDRRESDPAAARRKMVERLTVFHPLQPFDRRYYDSSDPRLASFNAGYFEAVSSKRQGRRQKGPFFSAAIPPFVPEDQDIQLSELSFFLAHPGKFFLQRRLQLHLPREDEELPEREPLVLSGLDAYNLGRELLDCDEALRCGETLVATYHARGTLPVGAAGKVSFKGVIQAVEAVTEKTPAMTPQKKLPPLAFSLRFPDGSGLHGELAGRYPQGLLRATVGRLTARFYLQSWLEHLCLCLSAPADQQPVTYLVGRGEKGILCSQMLKPAADAEALLARLVGLYWTGHNEPLLLFPKSSFEYAYTAWYGRGKQQERFQNAASRAYNTFFTGNPFLGIAPEIEDRYLRIIFDEGPPLENGFRFGNAVPPHLPFEKLAEKVYFPLFEHLEEAQ